jgi:serine/threonine protein kinase
MDFGIARSMEAVTRLTGSMVGTPAYMAPEQVGGKQVDYRTDIYSLGLILYEIFTGAQAFQAENAVAVALKQMRESPVPPHEIEPLIPVQIERAILKCLEKDPPKRFQSIAELERALSTTGAQVPVQPAVNFALNHHSSQAPALHPPFAPAPEPRRTSPVVTVLFMALLVIGGYVGWHGWQIYQATENLAPPAPSAAPAPPDFALDPTPPARPSAPAPAAAASAPPAADADKSADADTEAPAPARSDPPAAAPKQNAAPESSSAKNPAAQPTFASHPNQRRNSQGFGENEPVTQPPVNDHTPSYLWVGRFEREDKAQNTAKKIEDLGLPVTVVPRQGPTGQFFVVVTGPYGPERVESAMDYLKTQGFSDVRLIKNPLGTQRNPSN